ncbi:MAG: hypothetical protein IPK85_08950 [Gemmatimonadetes bacterium]|nr:hypothetical protein [Gemmatimonadota bacterium]
MRTYLTARIGIGVIFCWMGVATAAAQGAADSARRSVEPPTGLKQRNLDDSEIGFFGTATSDVVKIGALIQYNSPAIEDCKWEYALEVELVEHPGRFQWRPTHRASTLKSTSNGSGAVFLEVIASGLTLGKFYKWNVRRVIVPFTFEAQYGVITCTASSPQESIWRPGVEMPSTSFRTPVPYQNVIEYPSNVTIATGTPLGGNLASLRADDGNYYRLRTGAVTPPSVVWSPEFSNITPQSRNAVVRVRSRANRPCSEALEILVPAGSTWHEVARAPAASNEREWSTTIAGPLKQYLDAGVLRFRVTCTLAGQSFVHQTDLFELSYERAMVPWARDETEGNQAAEPSALHRPPRARYGHRR